MFKKVLTFFMAVALSLSIVGCGNTSNGSKTENNAKQEQKQDEKKESVKAKSQDELDKEIKNTATKADFVKINGHEKEHVGEAYYIVGEVSFIDDTNKILPTFTVKTKEGEGFGLYDIMNFKKVELKEGDEVKVFGKLSGEKSKIGSPQISGNVIEKQK